MRKWLVVGLVVLMLSGMSAGVFAEDPDKDIVETAIEADDFNTLVTAVVAAELVDALKGEGPFTVFAPTDAAFADVPEPLLAKLLANPDLLAKVLLYHVVEGQVLAEDVVGLDGEEVETLLGQKVAVEIEDGDVYVQGAQVVATDILCTNGVIHVIDQVILPEWDIVETAILNDDFNTLVTAVVAAELVDALKGEGPFTVFAPTDEAFAGLPEGLLEGLLADIETLQKVLLYHVVEGEVMALDVLGLDGEAVETLLGQTVAVKVEDGKVFINDAQVVVTDITCTNGVIHVLDAVLVPDLEEEDEVLTVRLNIGSTDYEKNGETGTMDVEPFIENGRTFVPVRFVAEAFGLEADWSPKEGHTEVVTLSADDVLITINIGCTEIAVVEGGEPRTVTSDVAAQIVHDRTFLPLRAVGEILGAEFDWGPKDELTQWVTFTTTH